MVISLSLCFHCLMKQPPQLRSNSVKTSLTSPGLSRLFPQVLSTFSITQRRLINQSTKKASQLAFIDRPGESRGLPASTASWASNMVVQDVAYTHLTLIYLNTPKKISFVIGPEATNSAFECMLFQPILKKIPRWRPQRMFGVSEVLGLLRSFDARTISTVNTSRQGQHRVLRSNPIGGPL
jgi:hypothetical protein